MAKLGYVRLSPLCPVSELGCAGLCVSVALMATYIYWAVLLHSLLCVIYSVGMGFRMSLGCVLCILGVMRYGVLTAVCKIVGKRQDVSITCPLSHCNFKHK